MSRSGYSDDYEDNSAYLYRGAVNSAINGRRGQAFLRDLLAALDALPEKRLIEGELECQDGVCALGALGKARGVNMTGLDPEDADRVATTFGIASALAREIVYENDEGGHYWNQETPEARFARVREWVVLNIQQGAEK